MKYSEVKKIINKDLYRYYGKTSKKLFIKSYLLIPGFQYTCWLRLGKSWKNPIIKYYIYRKSVKFGIQISVDSQIGEGLYIGHFGGIVISGGSKIGKNCNISQNVTIGLNPRGQRKGTPTIGNNCYIAPGAKLIGNVIIGDNVAIGANAVVTNDIPDNAVAVGAPAKVISYKGSDGYVNFTV